jgi:hypothetical protein
LAARRELRNASLALAALRVWIKSSAGAKGMVAVRRAFFQVNSWVVTKRA